MYKKLFWLWIIIAVWLTGCTGGAVVYVPTPLPPDYSPTRYTHSSGVFSLTVPRHWNVYEQASPTLATATFSVPNSSQPILTVAAINLGQMLDEGQMRQLMFDYQTRIRPDRAYYTESDRQAMPDGSWRMTGLRNIARGLPQQVNTFIQTINTYVIVMEITVPADSSLAGQLQSIINTFSLNGGASLEPTPFETFSAVTSANLEILHVADWVTPEGVFFITGEVANHGGIPVFDVPVRVSLETLDGGFVAGALDKVMGHGIEAGGFAPFALRFGEGQPPAAARYVVTVGGEDWDPTATRTLIGDESLMWTNDISYNEAGHMLISGTITNTGDHTVRDIIAIATVFDEAQNVIGAGFTELERPFLAPGEVITYGILIPDIGGVPANFIVNVQGLPARED